MTATTPPGPRGPLTRLRAWAGLSLFNQLSLATLALSLTVLLPAIVLSFVLSWRLVRQDLQGRLVARAELHASRVAMALQSARDGMADVAASPLLATALVDAQGWQQYGVPFLRSHRLPIPMEARLALCDFRGRLLASSAEPPGLAPLDWVGPVIERGEWHATVHGAGPEAHLFLVSPVRYAGSGTVEGALAAEIPLAPLGAALLAGAGPARLVDGGGTVLAGVTDAWSGRLTASHALQLPPPFQGLGLRVEAAAPAGAAERALGWLVAAHGLVGLLVLAVGLLLARRMADRLSRPLRDLAESAWNGSGSAGSTVRVPVVGHDETAMLAAAFNELLDQLERSRQASEAALRGEKREAEDALWLAHGALEHSNDAISISEPTGRIAYANAAACRLLERPRQEVVGHRVFDVDPHLTEPRWEKLWELLRLTGRHVAERSVPVQGGPPRWLEASIHLVHIGTAEYGVSVMRDVSARRQAEAALRLAGVGTLAAGAAHEINNPLTSVVGNLAFLEEELSALEHLPPQERCARLQEARQAVAEARHGAERVRDVVRGLKTFSRPDDEQQEPTDLCEVLRGAVRLARHEVRHLGRLTESYQATAPVLASGRRLEQVFVNLLVNAAQALQDAGGAGEVTVAVRPGPTGTVVAEVSDDGPGMEPEVRARVFEPFYTTKPVGAGTGLGLAICHGIVASYGGRIDVESEPGRGSTFRVVLPAMAAAGLEAAALADAPPLSGTPARTALPASIRILIVDDDPPVLRSVARALAGGPEVVAISDPHEALRRLLGGEPFDLLLCDLMMPGLSGMDLYAALAEARPDLATRVIFITGGAFTPRARQFLADGRHPCLEKPFEPEALRRLVAGTVGRLASAPLGS